MVAWVRVPWKFVWLVGGGWLVVISSCAGSSDKKPGSAGPQAGSGGQQTAGSGGQPAGNGGAQAGSGGTPEPATLESLITVICNTLRSCCASAGFDPAVLAACETEYVETSPLKPFIDDGTVTLNEEVVESCRALYRELSTSCAFDRALVEAFASCADLFAGNLDEGETCSHARQCRHAAGESSMCIKVSPDFAEPETGTCRPITHTTQGSECDFSFSCSSPRGCVGDFTWNMTIETFRLCHYEDGLFCNVETHLCEPLLADGAVCGENTTGALCALDLACVGGSCEPRKLPGQECVEDDCQVGYGCADGVCTTVPIVNAELCGGTYHGAG